MARTKYVPPAGVTNMTEYLEYANKRMKDALAGDASAFTEVGILLNETDPKGKKGFMRWVARQPQEWVEGRTLDTIVAEASTGDAFKRVAAGEKGSTGIGVFKVPTGGFLRISYHSTVEDDGDDE